MSYNNLRLNKFKDKFATLSEVAKYVSDIFEYNFVSNRSVFTKKTLVNPDGYNETELVLIFNLCNVLEGLFPELFISSSQSSDDQHSEKNILNNQFISQRCGKNRIIEMPNEVIGSVIKILINKAYKRLPFSHIPGLLPYNSVSRYQEEEVISNDEGPYGFASSGGSLSVGGSLKQNKKSKKTTRKSKKTSRK
jgi:hypothetical protein